MNRNTKNIAKTSASLILVSCLIFSSISVIAGNGTATFLPDEVVEQTTLDGDTSGFLVKYENIADLVDRNLEVLKAKNSLDSLYASDNELSNKLWDSQKQYDEARTAHYEQRQQIESAFPENMPEELETIKKELLNYYDSMYESQSKSAEEGIKSLKYNITALDVSQQASALAIVSTRQQKTTAAQQAFLNYYSLREKKAIAENQLQALERQIKINEVKLERKLVSQSVVDVYVDSKPQIELAISNYVTALKQNELALKTAIGLTPSVKVRYGALPNFSLQEISKRGRDTDRAIYLGRSSVIENARLGIGKAQVDYAFEQTNTYHNQSEALMSYDQAVQAATAQFEGAYDNMQDLNKAYDNSNKKLATLKKDVAKLEKKLVEGAIAKNTLLTKVDELTQAQHDLRAQKIDLYATFQSYLNGLML